MKKVFTGVLLLAVMIGLMLAGCTADRPEETTKEDKKPQTDTSDTPPQDTKDPDEPIIKPEEPKPEEPKPEDTDKPDEKQAEVENCIHAQWAEEVLTNLSDYEQFILGMDEDLPLVYFSTEQTVKDFKLLSLTLESIDDDGNINFTAEETYKLETMTPEQPLLARMELMGAIPNNGISYVDANGNTRYFTVEVSGYDGSLLMTEFVPQR